MNPSEYPLKPEERVLFALRALYQRFGYARFKMSKFEEYDLYARNKDFLVSEGVITFTDTDGRLMALKPDVTLSIIKNTRQQSCGVQKLYYNENVYRISGSTRQFKEIMQTGLECIGEVDLYSLCEVIGLAAESLRVIDEKYVLELSHMGVVQALTDALELDGDARAALLKCIADKNADGVRALCPGRDIDGILALIAARGPAADVIDALRPWCAEGLAKRSLDELEAVTRSLNAAGYDGIQADFSIVNDMNYYNGIVFMGYIDGIPSSVLSGGQYDRLMKRMGRDARAVGFAIYMDLLERLSGDAPPCDVDTVPLYEDLPVDDMVNIALPKGRLGEKVYAMFAAAGFECPSILEVNRKLIFENAERGVRYFWVKPSDVAIYVERGAADIGVAGKDILLEYAPEVYELLDLNVGKCRMAVAAKRDFTDNPERTLRVATKFARIARQYYAGLGRDIDIIHLNGSIEIAPILGLSDVIVDIVETGKTLLENDLEPMETIVPISARLIANKASYKFKAEQIDSIREGLRGQVTEND